MGDALVCMCKFANSVKGSMGNAPCYVDWVPVQELRPCTTYITCEAQHPTIYYVRSTVDITEHLVITTVMSLMVL